MRARRLDASASARISTTAASAKLPCEVFCIAAGGPFAPLGSGATLAAERIGEAAAACRPRRRAHGEEGRSAELSYYI